MTPLVRSTAAAALFSLLLVPGASFGQDADEPVWTRRPSRADTERYYPNHTGGGAGGIVALRCVVTAQGALADCAVAAEAPPGLGFGQAALNTAHLFRMKTTTRSGRPTAGGTVIVPVTFELAGGSPAPELNLRAGESAILVTALRGAAPGRGVVIPCPSARNPGRRCMGHTFVWRSRASLAKAAALLKASDQRSGVSLVECSAAVDGSLTACRVGGEATEASKAALMEFATHFRAPNYAADSTPMRSGRVLMEVDWGLMSPWRPPGAG